LRSISKLIIHCSATPEDRKVTVGDLRKWHVEERGWSDIGYHFFIDLEGEIHECRPLERTGAHTKGHNYDSIGICYAGGLDSKMQYKDTRNANQKASLEDLLCQLKGLYPKSVVYGHNDFSNKGCPCFNAKEEYNFISES
tara:strand:- start:1227 stop:1646 length:420 start_codon:yes stop_codon:yes gene_type:complete